MTTFLYILAGLAVWTIVSIIVAPAIGAFIRAGGVR